MLLLAGACEFAKNEENLPGKEQAEAMIRSLETMDYTTGQLTPQEADMLAGYGLAGPEGWVVTGKEPLTKTLTLDDGHRVALVFFPTLDEDDAVADEKIVRAVQRACKRAKEAHDLVIGLSPWGMWAEKKWLEGDPQGPDILLGSGRGVEMEGAAMDKGRLYWVRAYLRGKSVNRVDVYAWPERETPWTWRADENIRGRFGLLRANVQEDPGILEILSGVQGQ